jgi:acetyl esterase/lipase
VTAFALKYRLPRAEGSPYTLDDVRLDAYRAMRLLRYRAAEFHIDPARIGILGFSAGGVVVTMIAFDNGDGDPHAADPIDRVNGRPNFEMLVYPGGDRVPDSVPSDSPPAFMICSNDDQYECDVATLKLLEDFKAAKVSVEAHFLAQGKHGFNMGDRSTYAAVRGWPQRMADWLGDRGYLKPGGAAPSVDTPAH